MTGPPTLIVIGGGGPAHHVADWSRLLIAQAHRRGLAVVILDTTSDLASVPDVEGVRAYAVDYRDTASCLAVANRVAAEVPVLAVVGFREFALSTTAAVAQQLRTPWNDPEVIATCRAKDRCRGVLRAAGLPQPRVVAFTDAADAVDYLEQRLGSWVVKPRDGFGSEGVTLARPGVDNLLPIAERALLYSSHVLVEQFVEGCEFSIEGLFVEGRPVVLDVTAKTVTAPPFFAETAHDQPADISAGLRDELTETAKRAVIAVGLRRSLFHVEAWATPSGGVVCGEVHSRTGGDWIHAMVAHRRPGLELFGCVLDDLTGRPVHIPQLSPERSAAVVAVSVPSASGVVRGIHGISAAAAVPGCLAVDVLVEPGDIIGRVRDSSSRAALIIAGSTAGQRARAIAERCTDRLWIDVADVVSQ